MLTIMLFYIVDGLNSLYPDTLFNHVTNWHQSGALDVSINSTYLNALRYYVASTTISYPVYHYFSIDEVIMRFRIR